MSDRPAINAVTPKPAEQKNDVRKITQGDYLELPLSADRSISTTVKIGDFSNQRVTVERQQFINNAWVTISSSSFTPETETTAINVTDILPSERIVVRTRDNNGIQKELLIRAERLKSNEIDGSYSVGTENTLAAGNKTKFRVEAPPSADILIKRRNEETGETTLSVIPANKRSKAVPEWYTLDINVGYMYTVDYSTDPNRRAYPLEIQCPLSLSSTIIDVLAQKVSIVVPQSMSGELQLIAIDAKGIERKVGSRTVDKTGRNTCVVGTGILKTDKLVLRWKSSDKKTFDAALTIRNYTEVDEARARQLGFSINQNDIALNDVVEFYRTGKGLKATPWTVTDYITKHWPSPRDINGPLSKADKLFLFDLFANGGLANFNNAEMQSFLQQKTFIPEEQKDRLMISQVVNNANSNLTPVIMLQLFSGFKSPVSDSSATPDTPTLQDQQTRKLMTMWQDLMPLLSQVFSKQNFTMMSAVKPNQNTANLPTSKYDIRPLQTEAITDIPYEEPKTQQWQVVEYAVTEVNPYKSGIKQGVSLKPIQDPNPTSFQSKYLSRFRRLLQIALPNKTLTISESARGVNDQLVKAINGISVQGGLVLTDDECSVIAGKVFKSTNGQVDLKRLSILDNLGVLSTYKSETLVNLKLQGGLLAERANLYKQALINNGGRELVTIKFNDKAYFASFIIISEQYKGRNIPLDAIVENTRFYSLLKTVAKAKGISPQSLLIAYLSQFHSEISRGQLSDWIKGKSTGPEIRNNFIKFLNIVNDVEAINQLKSSLRNLKTDNVENVNNDARSLVEEESPRPIKSVETKTLENVPSVLYDNPIALLNLVDQKRNIGIQGRDVVLSNKITIKQLQSLQKYFVSQGDSFKDALESLTKLLAFCLDQSHPITIILSNQLSDGRFISMQGKKILFDLTFFLDAVKALKGSRYIETNVQFKSNSDFWQKREQAIQGNFKQGFTSSNTPDDVSQVALKTMPKIKLIYLAQKNQLGDYYRALADYRSGDPEKADKAAAKIKEFNDKLIDSSVNPGFGQWFIDQFQASIEGIPAVRPFGEVAAQVILNVNSDFRFQGRRYGRSDVIGMIRNGLAYLKKTNRTVDTISIEEGDSMEIMKMKSAMLFVMRQMDEKSINESVASISSNQIIDNYNPLSKACRDFVNGNNPVRSTHQPMSRSDMIMAPYEAYEAFSRASAQMMAKYSINSLKLGEDEMNNQMVDVLIEMIQREAQNFPPKQNASIQRFLAKWKTLWSKGPVTFKITTGSIRDDLKHCYIYKLGQLAALVAGQKKQVNSLSMVTDGDELVNMVPKGTTTLGNLGRIWDLVKASVPLEALSSFGPSNPEHVELSDKIFTKEDLKKLDTFIKQNNAVLGWDTQKFTRSGEELSVAGQMTEDEYNKLCVLFPKEDAKVVFAQLMQQSNQNYLKGDWGVGGALNKLYGIDFTFITSSWNFKFIRPMSILHDYFINNVENQENFFKQLDDISAAETDVPNFGRYSDEGDGWLPDWTNINTNKIGENVANAIGTSFDMYASVWIYSNNAFMFLGSIGVFDDIKNHDYWSAIVKTLIANHFMMPKNGQSFWDSWYGKTLSMDKDLIWKPIFNDLISMRLITMLPEGNDFRKFLENFAEHTKDKGLIGATVDEVVIPAWERRTLFKKSPDLSDPKIFESLSDPNALDNFLRKGIKKLEALRDPKGSKPKQEAIHAAKQFAIDALEISERMLMKLKIINARSTLIEWYTERYEEISRKSEASRTVYEKAFISKYFGQVPLKRVPEFLGKLNYDIARDRYILNRHLRALKLNLNIGFELIRAATVDPQLRQLMLTNRKQLSVIEKALRENRSEDFVSRRKSASGEQIMDYNPETESFYVDKARSAAGIEQMNRFAKNMNEYGLKVSKTADGKNQYVIEVLHQNDDGTTEKKEFRIENIVFGSPKASQGKPVIEINRFNSNMPYRFASLLLPNEYLNPDNSPDVIKNEIAQVCKLALTTPNNYQEALTSKPIGGEHESFIKVIETTIETIEKFEETKKDLNLGPEHQAEKRVLTPDEKEALKKAKGLFNQKELYDFMVSMMDKTITVDAIQKYYQNEHLKVKVYEHRKTSAIVHLKSQQLFDSIITSKEFNSMVKESRKTKTLIDAKMSDIMAGTEKLIASQFPLISEETRAQMVNDANKMIPTYLEVKLEVYRALKELVHTLDAPVLAEKPDCPTQQELETAIRKKLHSMEVGELIGKKGKIADLAKFCSAVFRDSAFCKDGKVDMAAGNQCQTDKYNQARRQALQVGCLSFFVGTGRKNFPFSSQMMSTFFAGGWDKIVLNMDAGGGKTENIAMIAIQRALMGYKTIVSVSNETDADAAARKTKLIYQAFQSAGLKDADCKVAVYEKGRADKNLAWARRLFTDNQVVIMTQADLQSRILSDRLDPEKPVLPETFSKDFNGNQDESDKNFMFDGTNPTIMSGASDGKIKKFGLTNLVKDPRLAHVELLVKISREFDAQSRKVEEGKNYWQKGEAMVFTEEGLKLYESIMEKELIKSVKSESLRSEYRSQILSEAGNMLYVMKIHKQGKGYELVDAKVRMINEGMRRFDWDSVQQEYVHLIEALHYFGSSEDRKDRTGKVKGLSEGSLSSIGVTARQTMLEELNGFVMFSGTNIELLDKWVQEYLETIAVEAHVAPTLKILPKVYSKNKDKQEAKVLETIAMSLVDGAPVLTHIPRTESNDQLNVKEVQSKMETLMDFLELEITEDTPRKKVLTEKLNKTSPYDKGQTNRQFAETLYQQLGAKSFLEKYKKVLRYNKEYHGKVEQAFKGIKGGVPDTMDIQFSENRIYLETVIEGSTKEYETKAIERFGSGYKTILISVNANRAVDIQPYSDPLKDYIKLNNLKALNDKYGYKEHGAVGIMTEVKKDEAYFIQEAFRLGRTMGLGRAQGKVIGIYSVEDAMLAGYPQFKAWLKNFAGLTTTEGEGRDYAILGLPDFPPNAMLNIDRKDMETHLDDNEKEILKQVYEGKKRNSIEKGLTLPRSVFLARGVEPTTVEKLFNNKAFFENGVIVVNTKTASLIETFLMDNSVSEGDKAAILELMAQTDKLTKSEFDKALEGIEGSGSLKKKVENYLYVKELVEINVLSKDEARVFIEYGMPESAVAPSDLAIKEDDKEAYKSLQEKVNKQNIETNMKIAAQIQEKAREGITSSKRDLEQKEKTTKTIHKVRELMGKKSLWKKVDVNAKYEHVSIDEIHNIKDIPSLFTMFYDYALDQHNREYEQLYRKSVDEIFALDIKDPKRKEAIKAYTEFLSKKFGIIISIDKANAPISYAVFQKGFLQGIYDQMKEGMLDVSNRRKMLQIMNNKLKHIEDTLSESLTALKQEDKGGILFGSDMNEYNARSYEDLAHTLFSDISVAQTTREKHLQKAWRLFKKVTIIDSLFPSLKINQRSMNTGVVLTLTPTEKRDASKPLFKSPYVRVKVAGAPTTLELELEQRIPRAFETSTSSKVVNLNIDGAKDYDLTKTEDVAAINKALRDMKSDYQIVVFSDQSNHHYCIYGKVKISETELDNAPHRVVSITETKYRSHGINLLGAVGKHEGYQFGNASMTEMILFGENLDKFLDTLVKDAFHGGGEKSSLAKQVLQEAGITEESDIRDEKGKIIEGAKLKVFFYVETFVNMHERGHIKQFMKGQLDTINPENQNKIVDQLAELYADFGDKGVLSTIITDLEKSIDPNNAEGATSSKSARSMLVLLKYFHLDNKESVPAKLMKEVAIKNEQEDKKTTFELLTECYKQIDQEIASLEEKRAKVNRTATSTKEQEISQLTESISKLRAYKIQANRAYQKIEEPNANIQEIYERIDNIRLLAQLKPIQQTMHQQIELILTKINEIQNSDMDPVKKAQEIAKINHIITEMMGNPEKASGSTRNIDLPDAPPQPAKNAPAIAAKAAKPTSTVLDGRKHNFEQIRENLADMDPHEKVTIRTPLQLKISYTQEEKKSLEECRTLQNNLRTKLAAAMMDAPAYKDLEPATKKVEIHKQIERILAANRSIPSIILFSELQSKGLIDERVTDQNIEEIRKNQIHLIEKYQNIIHRSQTQYSGVKLTDIPMGILMDTIDRGLQGDAKPDGKMMTTNTSLFEVTGTAGELSNRFENEEGLREVFKAKATSKLFSLEPGFLKNLKRLEMLEARNRMESFRNSTGTMAYKMGTGFVTGFFVDILVGVVETKLINGEDLDFRKLGERALEGGLGWASFEFKTFMASLALIPAGHLATGYAMGPDMLSNILHMDESVTEGKFQQLSKYYFQEMKISGEQERRLFAKWGKGANAAREEYECKAIRMVLKESFGVTSLLKTKNELESKLKETMKSRNIPEEARKIMASLVFSRADFLLNSDLFKLEAKSSSVSKQELLSYFQLKGKVEDYDKLITQYALGQKMPVVWVVTMGIQDLKRIKSREQIFKDLQLPLSEYQVYEKEMKNKGVVSTNALTSLLGSQSLQVISALKAKGYIDKSGRVIVDKMNQETLILDLLQVLGQLGLKDSPERTKLSKLVKYLEQCVKARMIDMDMITMKSDIEKYKRENGMSEGKAMADGVLSFAVFVKASSMAQKVIGATMSQKIPGHVGVLFWASLASTLYSVLPLKEYFAKLYSRNNQFTPTEEKKLAELEATTLSDIAKFTAQLIKVMPSEWIYSHRQWLKGYIKDYLIINLGLNSELAVNMAASGIDIGITYGLDTAAIRGVTMLAKYSMSKFRPTALGQKTSAFASWIKNIFRNNELLKKMGLGKDEAEKLAKAAENPGFIKFMEKMCINNPSLLKMFQWLGKHSSDASSLGRIAKMGRMLNILILVFQIYSNKDKLMAGDSKAWNELMRNAGSVGLSKWTMLPDLLLTGGDFLGRLIYYLAKGQKGAFMKSLSEAGDVSMPFDSFFRRISENIENADHETILEYTIRKNQSRFAPDKIES